MDPSQLIPELNDSDLLDLHQRIRPVIRLAFVRQSNPVVSPRGFLYFILDPTPRVPSFLWRFTPIGIATDLVELASICTIHPRIGTSGCAPTAAEILAQIPSWLIQHTRAYETRVDYGEYREYPTYYEARYILYTV